SGPSGRSKDPVNTALGNFTYDHNDLRLASKGLPLQLTRFYNSQAGAEGSFGRGWTHNYNIKVSKNGTVSTVTYADGHQTRFKSKGSGQYDALAGVEEKLSNYGWPYTDTLTFKDQTKYAFDQSGRLSSIIDKYGNTTSLTYVGDRLNKVTNASGQSLTFTYNGGGHISQVTDSAGRSVGYGYDPNNGLTSFTDARTKTTNYTYDSRRQLESIKEAGAVKPIVTNVYNASGQVEQQTDAKDNVTTFSYNSQLRETYMTNTEGEVTTHKHDGRFRLLETIDSEGEATQLGYAKLDRPEMTTSKGGVSANTSYDANGNLAQNEDPGGHKTKAGYNLANNNLLWADDALERRTSYAYDPSGKFLESVSTPVGTT
ncbi:hypothetical protein LCGC14_2971700, partial [marine sediment metagenome]